MLYILTFFNNIINDIFLIYSDHLTQLINIISIGSMLLINVYSVLVFYYNLTHGIDTYTRSTVINLLFFNFIALISTGITLYKLNPKFFGNAPNPTPSPSPSPSPTPTPTPKI